MRGVFITGTDTDVGKTWVGARLIKTLRANNVPVTPRKPVESGWNPEISKTDAWQIANAADKLSQLNEVCPNRFNQALSPVRAALNEGRMLSIQELANQCVSNLDNDDFLYVEGAGGFYSPLANDGLNSDLARLLNLPIILIAENRLGCINQVLLSVDAIHKTGLEISAIVLNQLNETEQNHVDLINNITDIRSYVSEPVVHIHYMEKGDKPFDNLSELVLDKNQVINSY